MKIQIALSYDPQGTYVAIEFEAGGVQKLLDFFAAQNVDGLYRPNQVHCTLMYSAETPYHQIPSVLVGKKIRLKNARLEMFGKAKDTLSLVFDSDLLESRHAELKAQYKLEHGWPDYHPHFALSEDYHGDHTKLKVPEDMELVIAIEKSEPVPERKRS